MFRRIILSVSNNRNVLNSSFSPTFRSTACKDSVSAPGIRGAVEVNHRTFGTTSVTLCESKNGEKNEELQPELDKDAEKQKPAEKKTEHVLNTEEANKPEASQRDAETAADQEVKTSKEGLLELLGAMKVDMTTKRRLKSLKKAPSEQDPAGKPRRVEMESTSSMFQQATSTQSKSLSPELVAAVTAAASTLPDRSRAESELLKQLRKHEAVSEERRSADTQNIGNIITDMKVGRKPGSRTNGRPANQIRFDDDGRGYTHDRGITGELAGIRRRKTAFSAKRLNIFSPAADQETHSQLAAGPSLWDADLAEQITQATNQRARNGFEEMIQWTREGKLWQYPINNEAGMEEEAKVPFHEHVFLHRHLEDGFPQHGPVQHFMELVVAGLSKNHQLTVRQKLEHITWFRDYFQQNQEILNEAEA
ncbi:28S ribosomal protein S31, mitochondrial [Trichomycterus rosablanca]|uniref:28S ribosomal protein S31, mitochondrial n=1 Tax=Trichomycterus rosablanca TaxID=2290929 RepID=UPI002F35CDF2